MCLKRLKNTFKIDIKNRPGRTCQTGLPGNCSSTHRVEVYRFPNPAAGRVRLVKTRTTRLVARRSPVLADFDVRVVISAITC